MKCDTDSYEVKLNMSDFAADDLSVEISEGELVIEADQSEVCTWTQFPDTILHLVSVINT